MVHTVLLGPPARLSAIDWFPIAIAVVMQTYVAALIYLNAFVPLRDKVDMGRNRPYSRLLRGAIRMYVMGIGSVFVGILALPIVFLLLAALTPGHIE